MECRVPGVAADACLAGCCEGSWDSGVTCREASLKRLLEKRASAGSRWWVEAERELVIGIWGSCRDVRVVISRDVCAGPTRDVPQTLGAQPGERSY